MNDELKARVDAFNRMQLPGQPRSMHMGTSYLVYDLWNEVVHLRKLLAPEGVLLDENGNRSVFDDVDE